MTRKITRLDLDALRECETINVLTESELCQYVAGTGTNVIINVNRFGYGSNSTVSQFTVTIYGGDSTVSYPTLSGYMLEPKTAPGYANVEGSNTAILSGTYNVQPTYGGTYKWEVANVPGRTEIKIHRGATYGDTTGCLLVGDSYQQGTHGDYSINNTAPIYNTFNSILDEYGSDGISINITGYR